MTAPLQTLAAGRDVVVLASDFSRTLETAEIALAALKEVDKLHYVLFVQSIPSEALSEPTGDDPMVLPVVLSPDL